MSENCELKAAHGAYGEPCAGATCVFWRVAGHLGTEAGEGCAIQHFELLGDTGVAAWLLSVKQRVEQDPDFSETEL